ncbi:MAG: hypothetical protein EXR21_09110 [Flavobacteriaceae bacterium]|nr:hypothetical protein [Flavobacteriaceae bacterium]
MTPKKYTTAFSELAKCLDRIGVDNTIGLLRSGSTVTEKVVESLLQDVAMVFGINPAHLKNHDDTRTDDVKYAKATYYYLLHYKLKLSYAKVEEIVKRKSPQISRGLKTAKYILTLPLSRSTFKQRKYQDLMNKCIDMTK